MARQLLLNRVHFLRSALLSIRKKCLAKRKLRQAPLVCAERNSTANMKADGTAVSEKAATNSGSLRNRAIAEYHKLLAADEALFPVGFIGSLRDACSSTLSSRSHWPPSCQGRLGWRHEWPFREHTRMDQDRCWIGHYYAQEIS